jgi:hypothetical protein
MKAIEIACRYSHPTDQWCCTAQAGEYCRMKSYLGNWYELKWFHDCRQTDALAMTDPTTPVDNSKFDEAVEG